MSPKWLAFIMFVWAVGALLSLTLEQATLGGQASLTQALTGYSVAELQGPGVLGIMKAGVGFLTTGLPKVVSWNYAFFSGDWQVVRWILIMTLSVPTLTLAAISFIAAAQGIFSRWL